MTLFLIVLFVAITSFIGYFHTETSPKPNPTCPACQLQQSALGALASPVFQLPPLVEIVRVEPVACRSYESSFRPDGHAHVAV